MNNADLLAYLPELLGRSVSVVAWRPFVMKGRYVEAGEVVRRVHITHVEQVRDDRWRLHPGYAIPAPTFGMSATAYIPVVRRQLNDRMGPVTSDVRGALLRVVGDHLKPSLAWLPLPRNLMTYLGKAI